MNMDTFEMYSKRNTNTLHFSQKHSNTQKSLFRSEYLQIGIPQSWKPVDLYRRHTDWYMQFINLIE